MKEGTKNIKEEKSSKKPVPHSNQSEELHTDSPMSEKDEVKKAEDKMRNTRKRSQ